VARLSVQQSLVEATFLLIPSYPLYVNPDRHQPKAQALRPPRERKISNRRTPHQGLHPLPLLTPAPPITPHLTQSTQERLEPPSGSMAPPQRCNISPNNPCSLTNADHSAQSALTQKCRTFPQHLPKRNGAPKRELPLYEEQVLQ